MGERRRLREQDRRSAAIAELHSIDALLADAAAVVERRWVQDRWFAGEGACLVGAVVQAAGGPATASSQVVHRTLGLAWHALYRRTEERVEWCPPPAIRLGRIRDLAAWNDRSGRTSSEIVGLLAQARALARRELAAATPRPGSGSTDRPATAIPA